jgi:hypothetical protein
MFGIDDDDHSDEPEPGIIRCSCGIVLASPGGEGPDLVLDEACDGCGAAYRRWEAEQHARWREAGIIDDDGPMF